MFSEPPPWTSDFVPKFEGVFWAPDITYLNGEYMLYYSVSSWGVNTSAIGLATNPTPDPNDPDYRWTDRGIVIGSKEDRDDFNAIDPCVFTDPSDESLWLAFGSFWTGIKLVRLDPSSGKRTSSDPKVHPLAFNDTIEAPYLYRHGKYYFLFVNWGWCCRGVESTYNVRVGRSEKITGPYLDKNGRNMLDKGGSVFLETEGSFIGPGQIGILREDGKESVSCHFYDGEKGGAHTLAIFPLRWTDEGWPEADW